MYRLIFITSYVTMASFTFPCSLHVVAIFTCSTSALHYRSLLLNVLDTSMNLAQRVIMLGDLQTILFQPMMIGGLALLAGGGMAVVGSQLADLQESFEG